MPRQTKAEIERDLICEVIDNYSAGIAADNTNRDLAIEDIRFVDEEGAQWDQATLTARGIGRPAYTFDRTSMAIDQVKGDQRLNTPQIKVRPVDNKSDRKKADVFEGLIRNIEVNSNAKAAYNTGFDFALKGGYGCWRVYPKDADDSFDQELCIGGIDNPFTVVFDPSARDPLKRDAGWALISERISIASYEEQFPGRPTQSLDTNRNDTDWCGGNEIRVGEYFKRVPKKKKTLALLSDGRVVDYDQIRIIEDELANPPEGSGIQPVRVVRKREHDGHIIRWWKISGAGILEGPIDYDWKYIPLVPIFGRVSNIEGKRKYRGLVRKAKDPQKAYNYSRTSMIEAVALVPRSPYIILPEQIAGYESMWNQANVKNLPYLFYKNVPNQQKPTREPMPEVPAALIALAGQAADDIKAATGKFSASLGEEDNAELPGAIRQRNTEGDISSYEFLDNLAQSIKYTGEILVDMIPKVYDGARIVRILGIDGKEDFVEINQTMPNGQLVNDLSQGRYDVAVDVGPAYTTQRMQAADNLMKLAGVSEIVQQIAADLIAKNLDFPGADELERRLRIPLIQQGIIPADQLTDEEKQMLPQGPPQPSPTEIALTQKLQAEAQRAGAQAQKAQLDVKSSAQTMGLDMRRDAIEIRKLMAEIVNEQLDALLKQKQLREPARAA